MKRLGFVVGMVALLGISGCATKGYVHSQADPLAERIGKLETKETQHSAMREADGAAIKQANDKADQALAIANKTAVDVVNANNDVRKADAAAIKAEAAAQRAEAAAARAEKAANEAVQAANEAKQMALKSEKVFKLEQKK